MKTFAVITALCLFAPAAKKLPVAPSCQPLLSGAIPPAAAAPSWPLKYRLATQYNIVDPRGTPTDIHVVSGEFTVTAEAVQWNIVTVSANAASGIAPMVLVRQSYMEGLRYSRTDPAAASSPDFFHGFPPAASEEKSLVWDELMFRVFTANLDQLRLNQPVPGPSGTVQLAGNGQFNNRRVELTWTGIGRRNGEDCLIVHYQALLNHFDMKQDPVKISARSDYFGDIWVSIRTRQIVYGTLLEEVAGVISNIPGVPAPQPLHVLRNVTLDVIP